MKRNLVPTIASIAVVLFLVLMFPVARGAQQAAPHKIQAPAQPAPVKESVIDIAFCLDTTGSMSGLIEGAKQKIWGIVNTVSNAKPKPVLRIALVAYRDIGDTYVTKTFDFTSDLETMYSQLRGFAADGGGDTPEHVNRALNDAVYKLSWTQKPSALKILYLVGDAPPHMDYQDGYNYHGIVRHATQTGIIVNTIQCGEASDTRQIWQEVARMADGKFIAIDQTGGMLAIASPYDADLAKLSGELNTTYVGYGASGARMAAAQASNDADAETRALPAAAERAASKAGGLYHNESWDLVDAVKNKTVKLDEIKPADMPDELKGKTVEEQKALLDQKAQQRNDLQKQIQDLSAKREAFLQNEQKKAGAKDANGFDKQVLSTLKEQGRAKGISFE